MVYRPLCTVDVEFALSIHKVQGGHAAPSRRYGKGVRTRRNGTEVVVVVDGACHSAPPEEGLTCWSGWLTGWLANVEGWKGTKGAKRGEGERSGRCAHKGAAGRRGAGR